MPFLTILRYLGTKRTASLTHPAAEEHDRDEAEDRQQDDRSVPEMAEGRWRLKATKHNAPVQPGGGPPHRGEHELALTEPYLADTIAATSRLQFSGAPGRLAGFEAPSLKLQVAPHGEVNPVRLAKKPRRSSWGFSDISDRASGSEL